MGRCACARCVCAEGGRRGGEGGRPASVRARPRHGSVGAGPRGPAAARLRLVRRAQDANPPAHRTADRGGHRQAAGASAGGEGLRGGVLV